MKRPLPVLLLTVYFGYLAFRCIASLVNSVSTGNAEGYPAFVLAIVAVAAVFTAAVALMLWFRWHAGWVLGVIFVTLGTAGVFLVWTRNGHRWSHAGTFAIAALALMVSPQVFRWFFTSGGQYSETLAFPKH